MDLSEDEVIERLRAAVQAAGGIRAFARSYGITPSYVHDVLNKRRAPSARVCEIVGIEKELKVVYREKPNKP